MAAALMTQWLVSTLRPCPHISVLTIFPQFNFVIAKLTPIMLSDITYGTFLVFGCACMLMVIYAILCVPETKGVPLESIYMLFEGNIIAGAARDTIPRHSRAKSLAFSRNVEVEPDQKGSVSSHVERVDHSAKNAAYGANQAGAA